MVCVFCGVTNCPMTSLLLSLELFAGDSLGMFTGQSLGLFAVCIAVSYMLSGYYGLYSEQKIVYSKLGRSTSTRRPMTMSRGQERQPFADRRPNSIPSARA